MRDGASDRLSQAEYGELSFYKAMEYYELQIEQELVPLLVSNPETEEEKKENNLFQENIQDMRAARRIALDIYEECWNVLRLTNCEKELSAALRMQQHKSVLVNIIGFALESGDWSRVAL